MNSEDQDYLRNIISQEITKATFEKLHVLSAEIDRLRSSVKANSEFNTLKWEATADLIDRIRHELEGDNSGSGFILRLYALERDLQAIKDGSKATGGFVKDISVQVVTVLVTLLLSGIGWLLLFLFKLKGLTP